ncbi:hypothetical protein [Dokdonia sp.]|uniref:hypothetical protein n=1 Tax=Dokdonia sp. TaxID=2024995 RepID=UPI003265390B
MRNYLIINWSKIILWLLPPILRRQRHYVWLIALLKPLRTLYTQTLFQMQHNGQVIYLEKVLNETFNPNVTYDPNLTIEGKRDAKFIYIDETLQPNLQFIYKHEEYYLHTEEEHLTVPVSEDIIVDGMPVIVDGVTQQRIILDELGFLDPIELFTCEELKIDTNTGDATDDIVTDNSISNDVTSEDTVSDEMTPDNENTPPSPYRTFLADSADFTDITYANFRIMMPTELNVDINEFNSNNDNMLTELEVAIALRGIADKIFFVPHPNEDRALAGAVEVRTPRFHQVVNFYKLAGKTYETFTYGSQEIAMQTGAAELQRICNPQTQISSRASI